MAKKPKLDTLNIEDIALDQDFQMRAGGLNDEHVKDMMDALEVKAGCLPRVPVFKIDSVGYVAVGGFHRIEAHIRKKLKTIQAEVHTGSLLEATIFAAKENIEHRGLTRTHADKRRAVTRLLEDLRNAKQVWTQRKIAEELHISHWLVGQVLAEKPADKPDADEIPMEEPPKPTGRDGRTYTPPPKLPAPKVKATREKKAAPAAGVDAGNWEAVPLAEFLDVDNYIQEALDRSNVTTAGDLYRRIVSRGESFSLPKSDVMDLRLQCEKLRTNATPATAAPAEPVKVSGTPAGFDWVGAEATLAKFARMPNAVLESHPDQQGSIRFEKLFNYAKEFVSEWKAWRLQLEKRS